MLEINKCHLGDCMKLIKQIPNNTIDMILTDPPYDVDYDEKSAKLEKLGKAGIKQIERDKVFIKWNVDYDKLAKEFYCVLKNNSHCYVFCSRNQIHNGFLHY